LRAGFAVLALSAGLAAFAPAALAQTGGQDNAQPGNAAPTDPANQAGSGNQPDGRRRPPPLTDEQKACLEKEGVKKLPEGQEPTQEQRDAFRAAARKCDIPLPHRRPPLTDEQKACLEKEGVKKLPEGQEPTQEQREAFRAAAQKCDIPLPHRGPPLTDEQRACLEKEGVAKPTPGQPPTQEQRDAFKAAADRCGIKLPPHPDGPRPGNGPGPEGSRPGPDAPGPGPEGPGTPPQGGAGNQNQSTSV
jgi:hypothetical protein